jgi:hypothetical protein
MDSMAKCSGQKFVTLQCENHLLCGLQIEDLALSAEVL